MKKRGRNVPSMVSRVEVCASGCPACRRAVGNVWENEARLAKGAIAEPCLGAADVILTGGRDSLGFHRIHDSQKAHLACLLRDMVHQLRNLRSRLIEVL